MPRAYRSIHNPASVRVFGWVTNVRIWMLVKRHRRFRKFVQMKHTTWFTSWHGSVIERHYEVISTIVLVSPHSV